MKILHRDFAKNICAALRFLAKWLLSFPIVWISNSSISETITLNGRGNVLGLVLWSVRKEMFNIWHYLRVTIKQVLKKNSAIK